MLEIAEDVDGCAAAARSDSMSFTHCSSTSGDTIQCQQNRSLEKLGPEYLGTVGFLVRIMRITEKGARELGIPMETGCKGENFRVYCLVDLSTTLLGCPAVPDF